MMASQRMHGPATFAAGVLLGQEERDQEREVAGLLIAQLDLDRQFKHGSHLVCAGWPANLLRVGFGGYESRGKVVRHGSWPPNDVVAYTAPGITLRHGSNSTA